MTFRLRDILGAALVVAPLIAFAAAFFWFSKYQISQNPTVNASASNPLGFLLSNFVYDGFINIENLIISCLFLAIIFLYYPRYLRITSALFMPLAAISSGVVAELAAISLCVESCSFYGMSGVAGGIIGFTFANFSISFGLLFLHKDGKIGSQFRAPLLGNRLANKLMLVSSFIAYILLLLIFSGFFEIRSGGSSNQFPVTVQIPETIAASPQSVQIGHTTGIVFGFAFFLALFFWTSYRAKLLG